MIMRLSVVLTIFVAALSCTTSAFAQNVVYDIDYSYFVDEVYPNVDEPLVILFGSNYCGASIKQLKMLKRKAAVYGDRVKFYCVNADKDENYEWLLKVSKEENFEELGTPSWLFYYGNYKDEDGVNHYVCWSGAGMIPESTVDYLIERQIELYYK